MAANIKYVLDAPIRLSSSGSYLVTTKAQSQLKQKVIGAASDFASGAKSSALSVQARGPIPITNLRIE